MEGYRSGHNGVVLKTIRAKAHAGSNPAPSAIIVSKNDTFCSKQNSRLSREFCFFLAYYAASERIKEIVCVLR